MEIKEEYEDPRDLMLSQERIYSFQEVLFESRRYADISIQISGQDGPIFQAHKDILISQSKKFAKDLAKLNDDTRLSYPDISADDFIIFQSMLRFCYVGKYKTDLVLKGSSPLEGRRNRLSHHVSMYMIGLKFRIKDLSDYAADEFKTTADLASRANDLIGLARVVNEICERWPDQESNSLRVAAVEAWTKAMSQIPDSTTLKSIRKMIQSASNVAEEVAFYINGYGVLSQFRKWTCSHCDSNFYYQAPEEQITKTELEVCPKCPITEGHGEKAGPLLIMQAEFPQDLPQELELGSRLTLWKCKKCHQMWQCDALPRRKLEMEQCLSCQFDPIVCALTKPLEIHWDCSGCDNRWRTHGKELNSFSNLRSCICCPMDAETIDGETMDSESMDEEPTREHLLRYKSPLRLMIEELGEPTGEELGDELQGYL